MAKEDSKVSTVGDVKRIVHEALEDFAQMMLRQFERIEKRFQDLELSRREDWAEQREWNQATDKRLSLLDDSVKDLHKKVQSHERLEHDVYKLDRRVTKLEQKAR